MRVIKYGLLVMIGLLSGCFLIGPDYQKPDVTVPEQWRFAAHDAQNTANLAWWQQFNDPVLNRLIAQGLENNLDLRIAIAHIEQFVGVYGATRSSLFPQLSGQGAYDRRQVSGNSTGLDESMPDSDLAQLGINLLWELDVWGQLRRAKQAAYADVLAQEAVRDGVILTLVSAIAQTYIDLRTLDHNLEITHDMVKTLTEENRIAKIRFDIGYGSEIEVSQSDSELERRRALIPHYEELIAQTEHALCLLLGQPPAAIDRGLTLNELPLLAVPAGLPSDLLRRRPDIQRAEQNLIAATAQIGVAKGEYFPKIRLTGDLGQASLEVASLFTPGANFWTVGARFLGPLFTAGRIAGQVQTAEAAQQAALAGYQKAILDGLREFEDALVSRHKADRRHVIQQQRVQALQHYVRLSHLRFDEGYTSYLEVLDALRQYYEGQIDRVQARNQTLISVVTLYRAMGGGWLADLLNRDEDSAKSAAVWP
ncbi:MAG: efflux transporter outer membrane subunit [Methylomicrobium sp.]